MKQLIKLLCIIVVVFSMLSSPVMATFIPVDFSSSHNVRIQDRNSSFPEGDIILGGIPFEIPVGGYNEWSSGDGRGGGSGNDGQWILDVPVNASAIRTVYTLINTHWGTTQSGRMIVEFFGSDGAYFSKDLIGSDDIRDWNLHYGDQINGVTTVNVVYESAGHDGDPDAMDMQIFELPIDFYSETLQTIRVTDNRTTFIHSGLVSGITVVPEPATIMMLGLGGLVLLRRRKIY
jgi:hypothetical protein